MNSFDQLFEEFPPSNINEWKAKVISDLKGRDYEELLWKDENEMVHQAYYDEGSLEKKLPLIKKSSKGWQIFHSYYLKNWSKKALLKELKLAFDSGLEKAILEIDDVKVVDDFKNFDQLLFYFRGADSRKENSNFMIDPISNSANKSPDLDRLPNHLQGKNNLLLVEGSMYGEKGATAVQEIAYTLWHLVEYFDQLTDAGMSSQEIVEKLLIKTSIATSYFTQIAKIRALRLNLERIFAHYKVQAKPMIWAESNPLYLDHQGFNNNLIRLTTQAMSAVLGGSDCLSLSIQATEEQKKSFAVRMCRNVQLLLKHESHLDEVDDLVRGAYYIESLSQEMVEKAWELFLSLEKSGSILEHRKGSGFWLEIEDANEQRLKEYKSGKRTMVAVNKFIHQEDDRGDRIISSADSISKKLVEEAQ